jgi:hypothetical protein
LAKAHVWCIFGVFAEMQVVPASGVLEQVDDAYRVSGFPLIFVANLWDEIVNGSIKGELAFADEFKNRKGCKGLLG